MYIRIYNQQEQIDQTEARKRTKVKDYYLKKIKKNLK